MQTGVDEIVEKRDRDTVRNCNRVDDGSGERVVEQASGSELRERVELGLACGAVSDAGVFVDVFERREKPEFVLDYGTADCGEIILPRERLFGIGRGIVNREASIETCCSAVETRGAVPEVRAALRGDDDGGGGCAAGVGVLLCRAYREFLDRLG